MTKPNFYPEIDKRVLIFLLSSIGLITFPHVYNVPIAIFAFFALLLSWRFVGVWQPRWLPPKLMLFLLTLGGVLVLLSQYRSFVGRDAGTSLFVIALALKLLEIKQERDLYLIVYLAFIVASSQFLFEQSMLMAGYILFVCCVLLATLVSINTRQPKPWLALKKASIILLQAAPMATVMFVLFPRIEAPRWMLFKDTSTKAKIGLSDSIEPGSISDLGMSAELAFRVKFKAEIPAPPLRYWRGPVFSYTDGKRWTQSSNYFYAYRMDKPRFRGQRYEYTLMMEPQDKNWVFALEMPQQFSQNLNQSQTYQLLSSELPGQRAEYQLVSYPDYNTGYLTKGEYQENTQLPDTPSDQIKALVSKLHGFDQTPEVFINNLLQHFRQEKFYYTLSPPLMEDKPIETFLFKTRYGFCSHYATAFTYLMRVAKIPARVVGGYQGGEINKIGGFLEVRQADAHAWSEVWLENKGWVRVDPTAAIAPERIERGVNVDAQVAQGEVNFSPIDATNQAWFKQVRQMWQSLDYSWQRWVINYDTSNQMQFLSNFGIASLKTMLHWMLGIIAFIILIMAWLLFRKNRPQQDKALVIYNRFCHKLAKLHLERRASEGAQDFARRACIQVPQYQQQIQAITDLYLCLRYGRQPNAMQMQQFKRSVAEFKP